LTIAGAEIAGFMAVDCHESVAELSRHIAKLIGWVAFSAPSTVSAESLFAPQ
jgi:hypothetical protein